MYARRAKASQIDTVRYEIDMLDFCFGRCMEPPGRWEEGDHDVYLECFLVHYRNLIEFLGGANHHREDDLSTSKPEEWAEGRVDTNEIRKIRNSVQNLDQSYYSDISKYIQHCTAKRHEVDRGWDVNEMFGELNGILSAFETAFPRPQGYPVRNPLTKFQPREKGVFFTQAP